MLSQIIHSRFIITFLIFFFQILCFHVSHSVKRFELIHRDDDLITYINKNPIQGYEKLSVEDFHACVYNYHYLRLPQVHDIPLDHNVYSLTLVQYCENIFKTLPQVEMEYKIHKQFFECISELVACLKKDDITKFSGDEDDSESGTSEHEDIAIRTSTVARTDPSVVESDRGGEDLSDSNSQYHGTTLINVLKEVFTKYYIPLRGNQDLFATFMNEHKEFLQNENLIATPYFDDNGLPKNDEVKTVYTKGVSYYLGQKISKIQKEDLQSCIGIFETKVSSSLKIKLPEKLKVKNSPTLNILIQYDMIEVIAILFNKNIFPETHYKNYIEQVFSAYTGIPLVTKSIYDVNACNSNMKAVDSDEYNYLLRKYRVLPKPQDETYEDYIYKINHIVQFMKSMDGGNEDVYDLLLDNVMSQKSYKELRELKPIKDEDYPTYLLRSRFHSYIPLTQNLWTVEYNELYSNVKDQVKPQILRDAKDLYGTEALRDAKDLHGTQPLRIARDQQDGYVSQSSRKLR